MSSDAGGIAGPTNAPISHRLSVTAALPPKLLPKSIYGTSVWVHLLLEKFHLQRPMHRIISQLQLFGLDLAPGTIVDGLMRIEPLLTPVYNAIRMRQAASADAWP